MDTIKDLQDKCPVNRESAPFVYDIGSRVLKGAIIGYFVGIVFFKRSLPRKFCLYYGAGFGLGMNYT